MLLRTVPFGSLAFIHQVVADVITIQAGDNGQFYNPSNVTANKGDIVRFLFVGTAHSVVQTNNSTPCAPLPGGFDSGFAGLQFGGSLQNPMEWNLTITDDSTPIWFYCKAQSPAPHCRNGMVGVINVKPDIQTFETYINASRVAIDVFTPGDVNTTHLQGVGAFATALPTAPISKSSAGPVIGGVVGGVAVATLLFGLVFSLVHTRRKARRLEQERLAVDGSSWLSSPSARTGWRSTAA